MNKRYKIADLIVDMDTMGRAEKQAEPYIISSDADQPDILVRANTKEVLSRHPGISFDDAEYLSTGSSFYRQLLNFDGLMIHSSAVVVDNKAYLFSAPCGTGKSTHTALWRQVFGSGRVQILNDDKPALRLVDGVWYAYGTPWSGKTDQNLNLRVPLAGICVLRRGMQNKICLHSGRGAIFDLLMQTPKPKDMANRAIVLERLDKLLSMVPVWRLECNMEPEAARLSYETMSKGKEESK